MRRERRHTAHLLQRYALQTSPLKGTDQSFKRMNSYYSILLTKQANMLQICAERSFFFFKEVGFEIELI